MTTRSRGGTLLAFMAVVVLVAAGCGERPSEIERRENAEAAVFCEAWKAAVATGDDAAVKVALEKAPGVIAEEAAVLREAGLSERRTPEIEAAASEVFNFVDEACNQSSTRRLAPAADTMFGGDPILCGADAEPAPDNSGLEGSGMVIYGDAAASDPYDGPMVGVAWYPEIGSTEPGDGDGAQVTVRGLPGVAAPITVLETALPELGTVVSWTEGGRDIQLYGRQWPLDRVDELLVMAKGLLTIDGRLQLPETALPPGFREVFSGAPSVAALLPLSQARYVVSYRSGTAPLNLYGLQMSETEFEAFLFFTSGMDESDVGGHPALVGAAFPDGPTIVTWREPDGVVIRIVGLGAPLLSARKVASATRELSESEWAALLGTRAECPPPP